MDRILRIMPVVVALPLLASTAAWSWPATSATPREMAAGQVALPLPSVDADQDRSIPLEQAAQQAARQTRRGFELAGRGAYFAARSEFLGALRLVAEALDAQRQTNGYSQALASAMTALKEAEDFVPEGSRLETGVDVSSLAAAHATPVLKNSCGQVSPMAAMRDYLTYAQQQLAAAAGREVAGSMALHGLGKLHAALAEKRLTLVVAPESKAVAFYQAALTVFPENYMASNDLGVLLARGGRMDDARAMLEHSVAARPQSENWRNLAVVYRQLGHTVQGERAAVESARWGAIEASRRQSLVGAARDRAQWLDPATFAQTPHMNLAPAPLRATETETAGRPASTAPTQAQRLQWRSSAHQR